MNAMNVIFPYKMGGIWMFDDDKRELAREPFVGAANTFFDKITEHIPNADIGFRLLFSSNPFPGASFIFEWKDKEFDGYWYTCAEIGSEPVWLCPALRKYFSVPPKNIYLKVEGIEQAVINPGEKLEVVLIAPDRQELCRYPIVGYEKISVELLSSGRFKCLSSSHLYSDYVVFWGDEIEAEKLRDGRYQITELYPNTALQHWYFNQGMNIYGGPPELHDEVYESNELKSPIFDMALSEGGCLEYGEDIMVHFLVLHSPVGRADAILEKLKPLSSAYWSFSNPLECHSGENALWLSG
jgi:hypothetical protein